MRRIAANAGRRRRTRRVAIRPLGLTGAPGKRPNPVMRMVRKIALLSIASCAGLTRASILSRKKMDCRVKPGNDRGDSTLAENALKSQSRHDIVDCER